MVGGLIIWFGINGKFIGNAVWYFSIPIDYGVVTIGSSPSSGPNRRSRDISEYVWVTFLWRGSLYCCVESTSISSIPTCISGGMDLDKVTGVEVVCRDGSRDPSETT